MLGLVDTVVHIRGYSLEDARRANMVKGMAAGGKGDCTGSQGTLT